MLSRVWAITAAVLAASTAPALAAPTPSIAPSPLGGSPSPAPAPTPSPVAATPEVAPAIGGISARPIAADGTPLPGDYFDVKQVPGRSFTANLEVTNATDRAIPVHVAAVDTTTSDNGGTAFLATRAPRSGTGTWISPGRQALTLGADSSPRLSFRVRVPADARPGDHVGGIVIEPDRKVRVGASADITRVVRVAIAVRVQVPGDAQRAVDLDQLQVTRGSGDAPPTLVVRIANTGDLLCRPYLTATFSTDGDVQSSERRHVDTLLPKTTAAYELRWTRTVRDGTYDVRVRTEGCGAPSAVTEHVVLDTAAGAVRVASATPSIRPGRTGLSDAAQYGSLTALVLAAAATGWWLARRRPRRRTR